MSLGQTLLGSALGIGARVLEGFQRRKAKRDQKDEDLFSEQLTIEFDRRLKGEADKRAQAESSLDEEFNQRLLAEYQRRLSLQPQGEEPIPMQTAMQEEQAMLAPTPQPLQISPRAFDQLRQIWSMSRGDMNLFNTWSSQYPNPEIQQLMQDPVAWERVMELLQGEPTQQAPMLPGMDSPLSSSNIKGFSYDRNNGDLMVQFHKGGIYRYNGVPQNVFEGFANGVISSRTNGQNEYGRWWTGKNPSLGASHWALIRDTFPYQKVA